MGFYEYDYIEYNGYQSATYGIRVSGNNVSVSGNKGIKKYDFDFDKGYLYLNGDGKTLCKVEIEGVRCINNMYIDSEEGKLVVEYEMFNGDTENAYMDIKELVCLYKGGNGIEIDEDGKISVKILSNSEKDNRIQFDEDGNMYVEPYVGGDGIAIEDNIISYTGSTEYSGYSKSEIDEMISGVTNDIEGLSGFADDLSEGLEELSGYTQANIDDINERVEKLEVFKKNFKERVKTIEDGLETTGKTIEEIEERVEALEKFSGDTIGDIEKLYAFSGDTEESIESLNEFSGETEQKLDELYEFSANTVSDIVALRELIETTSGETLSAATKYTDDKIEELKDYCIAEFVTHDELTGATTSLRNEIEDTVDAAKKECTGYTDERVNSLHDEVFDTLATQESLKSYTTKEEFEQAKGEIETSIATGTTETREWFKNELSGHTQAMKDTIKKYYLQIEDAKETYVEKSELSGYTKTDEINNKLEKYATTGDTNGIKSDISNIQDRVEKLEGKNFITEKKAKTLIEEELSGYSKSEDIDTKLNSLIAPYVATIIESVENNFNDKFDELNQHIKDLEEEIKSLKN